MVYRISVNDIRMTLTITMILRAMKLPLDA